MSTLYSYNFFPHPIDGKRRENILNKCHIVINFFYFKIQQLDIFNLLNLTCQLLCFLRKKVTAFSFLSSDDYKKECHEKYEIQNSLVLI